jgi:hypothetical protein
MNELREALEALADKMGERCGDHCSNSCRMCEARNDLRLVMTRTAALAAPAVTETGVLTEDCLRKNLRIFIEELESLTGAVGVRAIAKRLRAELAAQAPQVAEPGALQELIGLWRDEDCKHTWAKKHANNDEPAELICANELSAALAAQAPKPATSSVASPQDRKDVNDLCEAVSRIRWARGTDKLDAAIFEAVRIQSIVDASHVTQRAAVPASPVHMHDEDIDAAERDAMLAPAPASLSTGRLERLRELIDAIRCCARDWLESADRNVVSIAYTTLRAHALVLREDYGPLDGKCTACGRIATAEPPASAKEKQSWNLGLIPRKEGTK